jgi:hypothetical protein
MSKQPPAKDMTVEQWLAELRRDPEFAARERDREKRQAQLAEEYAQLERPILEELAELGIDVESLGQSQNLKAYMPFPDEIVQVFLRWLPKAHERIQVTLAHLLAAAKNPFQGHALAETFTKTSSSEVRWQLADTIAQTRPTGITDWVVQAFTNPSYGSSRQMLAVAVARLAPRREANRTLLRLFDEFPVHVPLALAESGEANELEFLKSRLPEAPRESEKEIRKAIRAIEQRMSKNKSRGN